MGRKEKRIEAFNACRGVYPYAELVRLLADFGYSERSTNGGSSRKFVDENAKYIIRFHEPHPGNEVPYYVVKQVREHLVDRGLI